MKNIKKYILISSMLVLFVPFVTKAFDDSSKKDKKDNLADTVLVLEELDDIVLSSLQKGSFTIGITGRIRTDIDKNFDDFSNYVLAQEDRNYFIRANTSYFVKNRQSAGLFLRFTFNDNNYSYVSILQDTITNLTTEKSFGGGLYYKYHTPVFGSNRVYWISIIELGIDNKTRDDETFSKTQEVNAQTDTFAANLLVRFGFLIFPLKNFSLEGNLAALGGGYESKKFYENGEANGTSDGFHLLLTPELWTIQFKITTYF